MAEIRIGTSGWHYKHWKGSVYPPKLPSSRMLAWYQERFDAVEVNNTFDSLPLEKTFTQWRDSTPQNFRFSVKGSRFITHMKKLKNAQSGLETFLNRADLLKEKLGPILFQLPPNLGVRVDRLVAFLEMLPSWHRFLFEFRNESWNCPAVLHLLRKHNAAYCCFHLAGYQSPIEITADFTYIRLHGPGSKYQGSYDEDTLAMWASKIRRWSSGLKAIYVYFDNDDPGYAFWNALRLSGIAGNGRSS